MALVKVQAKGQMTVPRIIREAMGIETGTELVCTQTGPDVFECRLTPKLVGLRAFIEAHSEPEQAPTPSERHMQPRPLTVAELIERFSGPEPVPTPEEMQEIVREGILAEARAEYGDLLEE